MLSALQQQQFEEQGYLVVEDVLTGSLLEAVRVEAQRLIGALPPETVRRVWHERALFRRGALRDVLRVKPLVEVARDLIGPDVQLLALDLLYTAPGQGSIGWHRDVTFICNRTLSMNTGIYLNDMSDEMGPLRVLPGSHRMAEPPVADGGIMPGEVVVPVRAGTAVFFDAGLLHTGGANCSGEPRLGLFAYFGHYFIKRMDNYFTQALPAELLHSPDPLIRQLLGLGLMPGAPNYHGDDESYNRRGEPGIDYVE